MVKPPLTLAVDLGGTRMRAGLVRDGGELVVRRAEATPRGAACPDALMALVGDILADERVDRAVIGVPGRVDHRAGRLEYAPNLPPHWPESLDEESLSGRLGLPISLANDADLAAVGEAYFGAARGHTDVVYLTISTGIGAGVVLDRRLVTGTRSWAEVGHTVLEHAAGLRGEPASFEDLGSGTALAQRAARAGLPPDGARIVALVHDGDPEAIRVWDDLVSVICTGVINLAHLFTPSAIVLGGGVGRNGDLLIAPVREALELRGPRGLPTPIEVLVAELGDDAALVGAAGWLRAREAPCHG
ncbi:MAG TPA: ROK family protein [Longimicrobiales bacterium]|nr:ROK family protein [Longimicrobiales bacterium]